MARFNIYLDDNLHREVCEKLPKRQRSKLVQDAFRTALKEETMSQVEGSYEAEVEYKRSQGELKPKEYGPVNCNVARTLNGDKTFPAKCERCGSSNEASDCLFYDTVPTRAWGNDAVTYKPKPHLMHDSERSAQELPPPVDWSALQAPAEKLTQGGLRQRVNPQPADLTKLSPEEFAERIRGYEGADVLEARRAREAASVGIELTRVQRAKLMDYLEGILDNEHTDEDLNNIVNRIVRILND